MLSLIDTIYDSIRAFEGDDLLDDEFHFFVIQVFNANPLISIRTLLGSSLVNPCHNKTNNPIQRDIHQPTPSKKMNKCSPSHRFQEEEDQTCNSTNRTGPPIKLGNEIYAPCSPSSRTATATTPKSCRSPKNTPIAPAENKKEKALQQISSPNVLNTFHKVKSNRDMLKQDPKFESQLLDYQNKQPAQVIKDCKNKLYSQIGAAETKNFSPRISSPTTSTKTSQLVEQALAELEESNKNVGKIYASELGNESFKTICNVRRTIVKQNSYLTDIKDSEIKHKVERNRMLLQQFGSKKNLVSTSTQNTELLEKDDKE